MKTRKLLTFLLIVCMSAMLFCSCGNGTEDPSGNAGNGEATEIISKYGYDLSKYAALDWPKQKLIGAAMTDSNGAIGAPMRFYFDLISEASQGNITFDEYWEGQLCEGADTYENVRDGIADFGQTPINYEYTPYILYQVCFTLPFVSTDGTVTEKSLKTLRENFPEFEERDNANGIHVAMISGEANYQVPTTDKLDPDKFDLSWYKGAKLALGSSFFSKWCESIGTVPVTGLGAPACYEAYTTGVINGVFGYASMMYDWQYIEVCKSMIEQNIGALGGVASVWNIDTWNSFSPEIQTALDELADLALEQYDQWRAEKEAKANENMYKDGLIKVTLTDADREAWAEKIFSNDKYNTVKSWIADAEAEGITNAKEIVQAWAKAQQDNGHTFPYDVAAIVS